MLTLQGSNRTLLKVPFLKRKHFDQNLNIFFFLYNTRTSKKTVDINATFYCISVPPPNYPLYLPNLSHHLRLKARLPPSPTPPSALSNSNHIPFNPPCHLPFPSPVFTKSPSHSPQSPRPLPHPFPRPPPHPPPSSCPANMMQGQNSRIVSVRTSLLDSRAWPMSLVRFSVFPSSLLSSPPTDTPQSTCVPRLAVQSLRPADNAPCFPLCKSPSLQFDFCMNSTRFSCL